IHETADDRRVLVTHGDQFDADLRIGGIKERLGGAAYQWLLEFDSSINKVRERFGYDKVSIASSVKMRLKSAQQYIRRYEQMALEHARKRGLDGIVCGHIHKPFCFEKDGIGYFNDGDWVEHCSALIEDTSGRLHSVRWSAATSERDSTAAPRAA
ncbi:MAG: UDP-2,3-diacylglucosamine diphosphatase, partial [Pseudomonadota bacterium]